MLEATDDILQKLAFQRGVLTLLRENERSNPMIEKALEQIDHLIFQLI